MNTQHTPGPWNVFCAANAAFTRHPLIVSDAGEVAKATWAGSEQQTNANARLIAAAPDLLAALQMVNRIWSHDQTANLAPDSPVAIVRAAIAKATGGAA